MTDTLAFTPILIFKCLADETRARMTLLIARQGELCVCELTAALELSQPKISRHLAQLRQCGLLEDERRGQWVYYRLHPALPDWVRQMLDQVLTAHGPWLQANIERVEGLCGPSGTTNPCGPQVAQA
ncbi:MAG: metalloregulator ArsR/SmtB family transcription factor [Pseudomonadaceae bacterium]|jgi:ArsR family transcriptional regulator, arsenate/arsenite/antimonite-responsive transcriptional repressor|nr:metalloregulator ArsR/SmtB family transcription factor [Pseudomonas sp.]